MDNSEAVHPDKRIAEKLRRLYSLRSNGVRIDLGLRTPYIELLSSLGDPHRALPPCIHIAGTNGKGSTIAFMRAMLEAAGYKVHVYTSPHLLTFNERIVLAGRMISDDLLNSYLDEVTACSNNKAVTFFEFTTALAFLAFAREPADIILLETGLGGRLDCTNILPAPHATIITPISYDHTEFLGDTLECIAFEKAGIMKKGSQCIIGPQDTAVRNVLKRRAKKLQINHLTFNQNWCINAENEYMTLKCSAGRFTYPRPALAGDHQIANAGTAIMALKNLSGFAIPENALIRGLQSVQWPGRLEHITDGTWRAKRPADWDIWYDGGHNAAAGYALAEQAAYWEKNDAKPLYLMVGMMKRKNLREFIHPVLPYIEGIICATAPDQDDFHTADALHLCISHSHQDMPFFTNIDMFQAHKCHDPDIRIMICGSLHLYGIIHS